MILPSFPVAVALTSIAFEVPAAVLSLKVAVIFLPAVLSVISINFTSALIVTSKAFLELLPSAFRLDSVLSLQF